MNLNVFLWIKTGEALDFIMYYRINKNLKSVLVIQMLISILKFYYNNNTFLSAGIKWTEDLDWLWSFSVIPRTSILSCLHSRSGECHGQSYITVPITLISIDQWYQLPSTYDICSKVVFNVRFHTFHKVFDKSCGVLTIIQILGNNFENITFVFGACTSRMIEVVDLHSPGIQRHQNQKTSGEGERNLKVFHDDQMTDSVNCKISKVIVKSLTITNIR